jgi:hypothetical protein
MPAWGDTSWRTRGNKWSFTPYAPPPIPAGSYDPALDAQLYAAQRGYGDTAADTGTQRLRTDVDYGLQVEDINRAANRGAEDYQTNVGLLSRKYRNIADVQSQQAASSGIVSGGAILQAAAKRRENQGLEQSQLDTGYRRMGEDRDVALGRAGLGYGRQTTDLGTGLMRAGRELGAFTLDTEAAKAFQAGQSGYEPPQRPSNEFRSPGGVPYRVLKTKAGSIYVDQFGRKLPRRPA